MITSWPFDQPPNLATFTTRHVLEGEPICFVYRDWEDSGWQFFSNCEALTEDAKLVCLEEIYKLDPSIGSLTDLPPGWKATRESPSSPWRREREHPFPVFIDDGYYLDDATTYNDLPSAETLENMKTGDLVKLVFRFAAESAVRQNNECERMWVEITEAYSENSRYRGTLANDPKLHSAIAFGHPLWFHATHVLSVQL